MHEHNHALDTDENPSGGSPAGPAVPDGAEEAATGVRALPAGAGPADRARVESSWTGQDDPAGRCPCSGAWCQHGAACPYADCCGRVRHRGRYPAQQHTLTAWTDVYQCATCGAEPARLVHLDDLPWRAESGSVLRNDPPYPGVVTSFAAELKPTRDDGTFCPERGDPHRPYIDAVVAALGDHAVPVCPQLWTKTWRDWDDRASLETNIEIPDLSTGPLTGVPRPAWMLAWNQDGWEYGRLSGPEHDHVKQSAVARLCEALVPRPQDLARLAARIATSGYLPVNPGPSSEVPDGPDDPRILPQDLLDLVENTSLTTHMARQLAAYRPPAQRPL